MAMDRGITYTDIKNAHDNMHIMTSGFQVIFRSGLGSDQVIIDGYKIYYPESKVFQFHIMFGDGFTKAAEKTFRYHREKILSRVEERVQEYKWESDRKYDQLMVKFKKNGWI